jgi:hypothetical protein
VWWWKNVSPAVAIVGGYMCLITISSMIVTVRRACPASHSRELTDFSRQLATRVYYLVIWIQIPHIPQNRHRTAVSVYRCRETSKYALTCEFHVHQRLGRI